jgi:hypothetical protein
MSVVPSIIVLVITALLVFRRELTARLAALLRRSSRQLQRPPGLNVQRIARAGRLAGSEQCRHQRMVGLILPPNCMVRRWPNRCKQWQT